MIRIDDERINRLKGMKTTKEKKWILNCALNIIKQLDKTNKNKKIYQNINSTINRYYYHHYHNYYTKVYRNLPESKRKDTMEKITKRKEQNNYSYSKEYSKKRIKIFNLYKEGKLSKKSNTLIDKELESIY